MQKTTRVVVLAVLGAVSAAVSGCVSINPETDASSPVAAEVQTLVDANRRYPTWADFPRQSEPVEPRVVAAQVSTLRVTSATLAGEISRLEWTLEDSEAYAAAVAARIAAQPIDPVTAQTQAEIEEFARRTRERGRAPPPVDRR